MEGVVLSKLQTFWDFVTAVLNSYSNCYGSSFAIVLFDLYSGIHSKHYVYIISPSWTLTELLILLQLTFKIQGLVPFGVERIFAPCVPLANQAAHALNMHKSRKLYSLDTYLTRGTQVASESQVRVPKLFGCHFSPLLPHSKLATCARRSQGQRSFFVVRTSPLRAECEFKIAGFTQKIMVMPKLFCGFLRVVCGAKTPHVRLAYALRFGHLARRSTHGGM
jgi:hypothetical protein